METLPGVVEDAEPPLTACKRVTSSSGDRQRRSSGLQSSRGGAAGLSPQRSAADLKFIDKASGSVEEIGNTSVGMLTPHVECPTPDEGADI